MYTVDHDLLIHKDFSSFTTLDVDWCMSDGYIMSINRINMVIDKGRYVKYCIYIKFLFGVLWKKDILINWKQHEILEQNVCFLSRHLVNNLFLNMFLKSNSYSCVL